VLCPRCCGCGPAELVCSLVHCLSVSIQLAYSESLSVALVIQYDIVICGLSDTTVFIKIFS